MAAIIGGALGSSIPNIFGGFAPFPNTIATALLAYQSEAIGYGFGIKFQYSKRLIGAMTNEEFNALTPFSIGQIVESHNTELINRMKLEMPKWLDIQRHFIDASVEVEIAKANRTPSAWAEIITAFSGAASTQIKDSLDSLDPAILSTLLVANPILALIYAASGGGGAPAPSLPDDEPLPDIEPLPEHIEPDEHTVEEHTESDRIMAILLDQKLFKIIKITWTDPAAGFGKSFTTGELNHAQHHTLWNSIQNDIGNQIVTNMGGQNSRNNFLFAYTKKINSTFLH